MSSSERLVAGLLVAVLLAGCGFQLQGRAPLPADLRQVHVDAVDTQSDFADALRTQLRTAGVALVARGQPDAAVIRVAHDELTQRVLAVSSNNLPREYELTYKVRVRASIGERELLSDEEFEQSRLFTFDERVALAKEHEREQLRAELARDLAALVLSRLRAR